MLPYLYMKLSNFGELHVFTGATGECVIREEAGLSGENNKGCLPVCCSA